MRRLAAVTAPEASGAAYLLVHARPRYWEDAVLDGVATDDDTAVPGRSGDVWRILVDLGDGLVVDWPEGRTLGTHYKVCDGGEYWLLDASRKPVAERTGYVPSRYLAQAEGKGNGDYIVMEVGPDGRIAGWKRPDDDGEGWNPA